MNTTTHDQLTWDQALEIVASGEAAFTHPYNFDAAMDTYTDDVVVRYADFPEIRGRKAVAKFVKARFARQLNYKPRKELRAVNGNVIINFWDGTWTDAKTGEEMIGRGFESWTIQDGRIAVWEAAFNVGTVGAPPATPIV